MLFGKFMFASTSNDANDFLIVDYTTDTKGTGGTKCLFSIDESLTDAVYECLACSEKSFTASDSFTVAR